MGNKHQEVLQHLINRPCRLSPNLDQQMTEACVIREIDKKHKITESGQQNSSEYFLLDGILHRYIITEEGEFITTDFYVGPAIIMPHFVRTSGGRSIFSLQALTRLILAEMQVETMETLIDAYPEIRKWRQKVVEQKLKRNFVDEVRFRSKSAKERLAQLRKEYPNLENMIPHSCIASYVGVTPVSFSRLRKEITHSS